MALIISNENMVVEEGMEQPIKRLGALPAKGGMNQLMLRNYLPSKLDAIPESFDFWGKRKAIPHYDTGNNEYGNCTIASQAILAQHMERLEQRKTIQISRDEIVRVYTNLSDRLYGGGDNGAYEVDALNNWRNPDYTFRDLKGRPMTIAAFLRVNHFDPTEVRRAAYLAAAKGLKMCYNMPLAWAYSGKLWDLPEGQAQTGKWQAGTWGGHSTTIITKYTPQGIVCPSSWNEPAYLVSWRGIAAYASECYLVIDNFNEWKQRLTKKELNLDAIRADVNSISDIKIK